MSTVLNTLTYRCSTCEEITRIEGKKNPERKKKFFYSLGRTTSVRLKVPTHRKLSAFKSTATTYSIDITY